MTPLDWIPAPYRLLAAAAMAGALLIAAYAVGHAQGADAVQARWNAETIRLQQAAATAEAASRAKEQTLQRHVNEAIHAATLREKTLRADVDAARAAALGLRDTIASLERQLSTATSEACNRIAGTALDVFSACAGRYTELAEAADRCRSAALTLNEAWPE